MPALRKSFVPLTYSASPAVTDAINLQILTELGQNPRLTMSELGRRVGLSAPAVTERVRRLEEIGVILGYRLDVDPVALGLPLAALIRIKPNPGELSRVSAVAREIPEVVECHRVTGEDCLVVKVHLPNIEQLDRVLDAFLVYGSTTTSLIQSSPVPRRNLPLPVG